MKTIIKTTKPIDISHYSDKTSKLHKLVFKDIKVLNDDTTLKQKTVSYNEYAVEQENVSTQVEKIDENGNIVLDENGEIVYETVTKDELKFLRTVTKTIPYSLYYQLQEQIVQNLPQGLNEEEKHILFLKEGIKYFIVSQLYYKGMLTLNDFE